jgi:hypothetical protein
MKQMIAALLTIFVVVVVIGFYRGWFGMTANRAITSNQVDVTLTVDPDKANADITPPTQGQ